MLDVNSILGDHRQRYFGDGHKRTDYKIIFEEKGNHYYGVLTQSGLWSNKMDKKLPPHLSTLDGLILASLLVENYLEKKQESPEDFYLSQFTIRSGMKPIDNLNKVPVVLNKSYLDEDRASFSISVLDMKVNIVFKRFAIFSKKDNDINDGDTTAYLTNHLKDIRHNIYDINFLESLDTADKCSIFCKSNKIEYKRKNYKGIASRFSKNYSLFELLIIFSQMAEMLAYHVDAIDRECSETLWMKQVSAEMSELIPDTELELLGKITKNKLLDMKGQAWKVFEMSGTDTHNRINISSKIAHCLSHCDTEEL